MEDTSESDPREVEAARHNLNYIGMDGNIGCLGQSAPSAGTKSGWMEKVFTVNQCLAGLLGYGVRSLLAVRGGGVAPLPYVKLLHRLSIRN